MVLDPLDVSLPLADFMHLRLLTYNIHKGIGGIDRRYRPERIVETVAMYDPDIVMLQEVDENVPRSRHDRQVDLFGEALGLRHRAFQRNVRLTHGHYGNAILSRFPLHDVVNIDLSVPLKKRRRALAARCVLRSGHHSRSLLLFNLHLGLAGIERTIQMRRLLATDVMARAHHDTPMLVAGDFNDVWAGLGRRMLEPAGFRPSSQHVLTFPAVRPVRPLDRVYCRGLIEPIHCFASRAKVSRYASDHLPLVADFELPQQ
ncbi:MAG: endonuclease/exonuclease/phosphatase family protein [Pirellulales bacterium]|nr:endonuclease/exonuclease/phosphatase family protein [Planctomycetales bacterium]